MKSKIALISVFLISIFIISCNVIPKPSDLSSSSSGSTSSFSTSSSSSSSGALIFSDDFNRADNSSVGNSWTEIELFGSYSEISNNALYLSAGWFVSYIVADVSHSTSAYSNFVINATMMPDTKYGISIIAQDSVTKYYYFISVYTGLDINIAKNLGSTSILTHYNYNISSGNNYSLTFKKYGTALSFFITNQNNTSDNHTLTITDDSLTNFDTIVIEGGYNDNPAGYKTGLDNLTLREL